MLTGCSSMHLNLGLLEGHTRHCIIKPLRRCDRVKSEWKGNYRESETGELGAWQPLWWERREMEAKDRWARRKEREARVEERTE